MSLGSPPRVRGKDSHYQATQSKPGITPACAGKSFPSVSCLLEYRDHPRVCGEKFPRPDTAYNDWGSPPRMRGKACRGHLFALPKGITPAYAGKSCGSSSFSCPHRDHPRVCGEKLRWMCCRCRSRGSPPRMRGKVRHAAAGSQKGGITPAYAGKSQCRAGVAALCRDHPRVCGEKISSYSPTSTMLGSPPRMRGKDNACN